MDFSIINYNYIYIYLHDDLMCVNICTYAVMKKATTPTVPIPDAARTKVYPLCPSTVICTTCPTCS